MADSDTYGGPGSYGADAGQGLYGAALGGSAIVNVDVGLPGGPVEVGCDWRNMDVRYGRSSYLAAFGAGAGAVELYGQGGAYSAWNPNGLWAQARPGTPYRTDVPVVFGINLGTAATTPLFTGTTDQVLEDWPDWNDDRVRVTLSDGFKLLSRTMVAPGTVLPAERSGARVSRLLTLAAWPGPSRVDTGNVTLAATTVTNATAVADLLRVVGETEWGWLYVDTDGAVVFRQRDSYQTDPRMVNVMWSFTDTHAVPGVCYAVLELVANDDMVYNRANITVGDGSGTVRSATDPPSIAWYGPRDYNRTDLPLANVADADTLASLIVAYFGSYERRVDAVHFEAMSQGDVGLAIAGGVRINDRIRVYRGLADGYTIAVDLLVQGIEHELRPAGAGRYPGTWDVTLQTARALDLTLWGRWDSAVWDTDVWGP